MIGLMKNWFFIQVRREAKALVKLIPLILVALLLTSLFWRADLAATSGLFQSPPTDEPGSPTPELTPTEGVPEEPTAPTEPTVAPPPTETPTVPAPTATETLTPVPTSFVATPTFTPVPDDSQRYPDEDTTVTFQWGSLFDSAALAASYIWMCCGICMLFLIPLLFIALWVASRRRNRED